MAGIEKEIAGQGRGRRRLERLKGQGRPARMTRGTLSDSEERLRSFQDSATEGLLLFDSELNLIEINKAALETLGINKEDVIGKNILELSPDVVQSGRYDKYMEVIRTGKAVYIDDVVPHSNFRDRYLSLKVFKAGDGLGIISTDITERKRAEEQMLIANERLRYLLSSTSAVIYTSKVSGGYEATFISDNVTNLVGYEPQEFVEESNFWLDRIHPEDRQRILSEVSRVFEQDNYTYEYRFLHKDGRYIWMRDEMRLVRDENGRPLEIVGYWIDITERKLAEQKLLDYQEQLKSLTSELFLAEEHQRRRLAMGIHDDISQKLALARVALQSLNESVPDADVSASLSEVCGAIEQAIEDLHTLTFELSSPVLYELGFEEAVRQWLTEKVQNKYGIKCEFSAGRGPVRLDERISIVLFRAVRELLVNVIKHAKATTVKVCIWQNDDGLVRIAVEDNGVGFVPSKVDLLKSREGGFGLFSMREQLEYLGGRMEIESAPREGTRIMLVAPLKQEDTV